MAKSLEQQIEKFQKESWELASLIDTDQMKNKDRIFSSGLVFEETEFLKNCETEEAKKGYLELLIAMRAFYKKIATQQQLI